MEVEPVRSSTEGHPLRRRERSHARRQGPAPPDGPRPDVGSPARPGTALDSPDQLDGTPAWWLREGVLDEYDTPAEVDAVFRTQRRIAFGYLALFLIVTLAVPVMTVALDWWSSGRLFGAMSPNFAMAAGGLYVVFLLIGLGAATLASAVEDRMLGSGDDRDGFPG